MRHGDTAIDRRWRFWAQALLWLPAGMLATAAVRSLPEHGLPEAGGVAPAMLLMSAGSLVPVAPCGLPLALGYRPSVRDTHAIARAPG